MSAKRARTFITYFILIVFTVLMLAACNQPANTTSIEPITLEKDFGVSLNGEWYPIHTDAASLLAALGGDYTLNSAPSCVYQGEDKEFLYAQCAVYTNPDQDRDIWYLITLNDASLQTARGIKVGSMLNDIYAAYGNTYYWEGETILVYSISGVAGDVESPCLLFTMENNAVTQIEIYYPTNNFS